MLHSGGHGLGRLSHHLHLHAVEWDWQVLRAFAMVDDGPLEDADWQETDPAVIGDTVDAVLHLASQGRLKLRLIEWEAAGPEDGETFAVAVDPS